MRAICGVVLGAWLGLGLAACGTPVAPLPTPTPSVRPAKPLGCFRPLEVTAGAGVPRVAQESADNSARTYFRVNGVTLAQDVDATGVSLPRPPIEACYLRILGSDYSSSGQGGGGGADPLAGRDVWLLGYLVQLVEPWSAFRPGATVYLLVDARNAAPVIGCTARP